jgi:phage terminase small subunit
MIKKKEKKKIENNVDSATSSLEIKYSDILKRFKLTRRQKAFILNYFLYNCDAIQAALRAGYSAKTVRPFAYQNLSKPIIAACIQEIQYVINKESEKKLNISLERTLQERARVAYVNIANYFNLDGSFRQLSELSEDESAAIESIEFRADGSMRRIKMWNKSTSLDALEKYLGAYEKDNKQKGEVSKEVKDAVIAELLANIAAKQTLLPGRRQKKE